MGDPIRAAMKVADKLAQVKMKHNYVLLRKVVLEDKDDDLDLVPEEFKEHRLEVVAIGPGSLLSIDTGWERAPVSVKVGDMVQFHGAMIPVQVGEETMVVIQDTQVFLSVGGGMVH